MEYLMLIFCLKLVHIATERKNTAFSPDTCNSMQHIPPEKLILSQPKKSVSFIGPEGSLPHLFE
jgi:hypothetical protein